MAGYPSQGIIGDFAYGTGPGLRFHSPVGAIRLEFGYKLNHQDRTFCIERPSDFSLGRSVLNAETTIRFNTLNCYFLRYDLSDPAAR